MNTKATKTKGFPRHIKSNTNNGKNKLNLNQNKKHEHEMK
jgi:hypothetical protein